MFLKFSFSIKVIMGVFLQNTFAVAANDDVCSSSIQHAAFTTNSFPLGHFTGEMVLARIMMNAKDRALQTHKQKMKLGYHDSILV